MQNEIEISIRNISQGFQPGERLSGRVSLRSIQTPRQTAIRLFWFTSGKGSEDVEVVESIILEDLATMSEREFSFVLPDRPYSFSGKLITLTWGIEVITRDPEHVARVEFVMAPERREVKLEEVSIETGREPFSFIQS